MVRHLIFLLLFAESETDPAAWRRLGLAHISANRLAEAEPALLRACQLEQPPVDSCYFLARNRHALGQYELARQAFDLALAAPSSRVHRAAGLNYVALGRDADAERHLRRAVALPVQPPDDPRVDPRVDLGTFLFRQGRLPEAATLLEQAAKSNSPRAHLELGRVLLQQGNLESAAHHLEQATRLNPTDPNAHLLLARAYQRLGRDADAARELALGEEQRRRKQP
jgi:tetratricopeptide (TPR) repeat protein